MHSALTYRGMDMVARTPDERFADLPGYPWPPRYVEIADPDVGTMRMHYVEFGPPDADPVLLLHGQPTWSYLYRKVIAELGSRGHRVIAPDNIGFGRSDKPTDRLAYTLEGHIAWLGSLVRSLDLRRITGVFQDWGGPIGFGLLQTEADRFSRLVAADTVLHTCESWLAGKLVWANHGIDGGRIVHEEALLDWSVATQHIRDLRPSAIVGSITANDLSAEEQAAYDAALSGRDLPCRSPPDEHADPREPQQPRGGDLPCQLRCAPKVGSAIPHRVGQRRPWYQRLGNRVPGGSARCCWAIPPDPRGCGPLHSGRPRELTSPPSSATSSARQAAEGGLVGPYVGGTGRSSPRPPTGCRRRDSWPQMAQAAGVERRGEAHRTQSERGPAASLDSITRSTSTFPLTSPEGHQLRASTDPPSAIAANRRPCRSAATILLLRTKIFVRILPPVVGQIEHHTIWIVNKHRTIIAEYRWRALDIDTVIVGQS